MEKQRAPAKLAKLLTYILGHCPDEFGLVLDAKGFVKIKDLLKVLAEEEGWKYVRRAHIDEILLTLDPPPIEVEHSRIRAASRGRIVEPAPVQNPPKLLYTCIRQRAYPHVLAKGIAPMGFEHVILSSQKEMAQRMGKRIDRQPVLLIVNSNQAMQKGVRFHRTGATLFLAESIPTGVFDGPPLPKSKSEPPKADMPAKTIPADLPGSFIVDMHSRRSMHPTRKKTRTNAPAGRSRDTAEQRKGSKKLKKDKTLKERPPWRR